MPCLSVVPPFNRGCVPPSAHARLLSCRGEVIEQLTAPLVELLGREQTVAAVAHSPELLTAHKGRAVGVMATLREELGCVMTMVHARLPPGGVQGWRAWPHAQPGCRIRGTPSASARQLHLL